jgi:hypothetical protein
MTTVPVYTAWDGESFVPMERFRKSLDAQLIVGQTYILDIVEERSRKAHAAYFATVAEAWRNLPEGEGERFPSPDHLRKFALIKCGYAQRRDIVAANNGEALKLATIVKSMDQYALAMVSERVVSVWTAESQSHRAMGRKRFMASQEAVRDFCASMIAVGAAELERNAGMAA